MQRRNRRSLSLLASAAALALALGATGPARASGLLIADGGLGGVLEILLPGRHRSRSTTAIAVTTVEQVFHNTENRQVEALYTFPVPKNASVADFSMWINGKEMVGEVLEKKRAREIYDSYKAQRPRPRAARAGRLPHLRDAHLPDRGRRPTSACTSPTTRSWTSTRTG